MKKVFGQTVRDIKREVNKKVLKVPPIERKVLDATSNEPWGPHGSLLADIAQASKNYHEYQMIMAVLWKRLHDTGKNWRHVYKALTVLEYLVANGSERTIDEIREHNYQISVLFDFQYIDSSGRDQGSNVRRKSQSLVALVNDKEKIQEVREKAAANRDKYRNMSTGGGMYHGSQSNAGGYGDRYDEDRYGNRDDGRNDYGREREWGSRDDDRYGRYGDSYVPDGDRYHGDNEERYDQEDDYRGRSENNDDGSRNRSTDQSWNRASEDDGQSSSRGSNAKGNDHSQDGRHLDHKFSDKSLDAPPSYEEVVGTARSPTYSERDGEPSAVAKASSPQASATPSHATTLPPTPALSPAPSPAPESNGELDGFADFNPRGSLLAAPATSNGTVQATSSGAEMDLLGAFSEPSSNSVALVSAAPGTATSDAHASPNSSSVPAFTPTSSPFTASNQPFDDDPFGDGPFRAIPPTENAPAQQQIPTPTHSLSQNNPYQSFDLPQPVTQNAEYSFGDNFHGAAYTSSGPSAEIPQFQQQQLSNNDEEIDILADILPPSGASPHANLQIDYPATSQPVSQTGFPHQTNQPESHSGLMSLQSEAAPQTGFHAQNGDLTSLTAFPSQSGQSSQTSYLPSGASPHANPQADYPVQTSQPVSQIGFPPQSNQHALQSQTATQTGFHAQNGELSSFAAFPGQQNQPPPQTSYPLQQGLSAPQMNFLPQSNQSMALTYPSQTGQTSQMGIPTHGSQVAGFQSQLGAAQPGFHASFGGQSSQPTANFFGGFNPQTGSTGTAVFNMAPLVSTGLVPQNNFLPQSGYPSPLSSQSGYTSPVSTQSGFTSPLASQSGYTSPVASQTGYQASQVRPNSSSSSQSPTPTSTGTTTMAPQPSKDKFETKSTVWADTLSRGLVNLNISGPKTNPLADIGVDFDAINRKEKRMEKPATSTVTSTVTMGKAMGSGSGLGRAGASVIRPPPNSMIGPGMGMGGYQGPSQPMGMGMNGHGNMGMGMGMNMGQGVHMQQQPGFPPGSAGNYGPPGSYNPMMGGGNYGQQPYGGGYR